MERVLTLRDCPARLSPAAMPPDTGVVIAALPAAPNLLGLSRASAEGVMKRYRTAVAFEGTPSDPLACVVEQSIAPGEPLDPAVRLTVKCQVPAAAGSGVGASVPDLTGLPLRQAINRLILEGLRPSISGNGFVAAQAPAPGALVRRGTACALVCKPVPPSADRPAQYAYQAPGPEPRRGGAR
jgi:beta-lactam-binding protein with PASTA domain